MAATRRGLRAVAALEAFKGLVVLLIGAGLLSIVSRGGASVARELVAWLHLDPDGKYSRAFIDAVEAGNPHLWVGLTLAAVYAFVRFVEAYGLWRAKRWAEWFAVASFGIYVPFEIYEMWQGVSVIKTTVLGLNVAIVVYLVRVLWDAKRTGMHTSSAGAPDAA